MTLAVADQIATLRERVERWRSHGERVALVPTMGNLHAGHLALLSEARRHCERTVASVFVNPTQFGPGEDYESYPRTRDADLGALETAGCDLAWMPAVETMYPLASPFLVRVPDDLADCLCGRSRPGHFDGVASVVLRLFNQVRPDAAVFGEKDFQQLVIIRRMVADLAVPVTIHGMATVREDDGLAMSSRNGYLDEAERRNAPLLYRMLCELAGALRAGGDFESLRVDALRKLESSGFSPDYLEWRSARDLGAPDPGEQARLFAAAWLGKARLIDNVAV